MKPQRGDWREQAASLLLALVLAVVLGTAHAAAALQPVPPAAGYVTDLTGTLDAAQDAALEQQLAAFEARKGSQVAVLVVPSTAPEPIEDYALRVAEQWKPGRRKVDDGALLVIALQDRQLRIEVGYGLEGVLPDVVARRIIDEAIVPKLRAQDLHGAVAAGVDRITRTIDGEALPPPDAHFEGHFEGEGWMPYLPAVAMAAWVLGMVLRRLMGRPAAAALSAGLAGGGAWWFTGLAAAAWAAAAMAAVVVLFGGFIGPRAFGLPWNGSGRGGGGGGFRGGGGGFGGGGASGRW